MHMMSIDPHKMSLEPTLVDLNDYQSIQRALGNRPFEEIRLREGGRVFVDADAKIFPNRPARFLIPCEGQEPLSLYGKALIVLKGNKSCPEIVFPKERRVTDLDCDFRHLGFFVTTGAGDDASNLNFQAILSDKRFVAATRVVLASFEPYIRNVILSVDFIPMLELEIERNHIGAALDLYDEVLTGLGVEDRKDDVEEEPEDRIVLLPDGQHRMRGLRS